MRRYVRIIIILFALLVSLNSPAFSQSTYVLPYPSFMPGSKWYIIQEIVDDLKKYWYFGSFSQFKYNLSQSDKYLVEAKTLFEYGQYLLAYQALQKSDNFFSNASKYLVFAKSENKNISQNKKILKEASLKHVEILYEISEKVPREFLWQPEKASSTILYLRDAIEQSIAVREQTQ